MSNIIIILGLLFGLGGMLLYIRHVDRKAGRTEQRLKNAEQAIKNVEKANRAGSDSSYDDELRDKYGQ